MASRRARKPVSCENRMSTQEASDKQSQPLGLGKHRGTKVWRRNIGQTGDSCVNTI